MIRAAVRVMNAILNTINKVKKRKAANDPAAAISNGGRVRESEQKFSDLADEPRDNKTE